MHQYTKNISNKKDKSIFKIQRVKLLFLKTISNISIPKKYLKVFWYLIQKAPLFTNGMNQSGKIKQNIFFSK